MTTPCWHCNDTLRCACPFCSPGYEYVNGEMKVMWGMCINGEHNAKKEG